jgi:DNA-binding NarL/FixJ family response regulator
MTAPLLRFLVVEDYMPFRSFICSTLATRINLQVICEVCDGLEAVHLAKELQPDLILLDIGLPTLNGLEAARQICKFSKAKIIFLSQESDTATVREALALGAWGYVLKGRAVTDLLEAVDAVCGGRTFVSDGLSGQNLTHGNPDAAYT